MRALALTLALLGAPSIALAQAECEEGRERVDGRCCWPGQTFSVERLRCEGPPHCPPALTEHGDACVARATTSGPPLPPPPTEGAVTGEPVSMTGDDPMRLGMPEAYGGVSTREWPTHGEDRPWRAVHVRGEDEGLIIFSFSIFEFGFILGLLTAGLDEQAHPCFTSGGPFGGGVSTGCNSWPLAFIPIGGGVASGFANFGVSSFGGRAFGYIFGIPSVLLQLIGLVSMMISFSNATDELGFRPIGDPHGVSLSFVPGASGSDVGLSLDLRF